MTKQDKSIDNLSEGIEDVTNELNNNEEPFENQLSKVNYEINKYGDEISSLSNEFNNFKEIIEKTKEYLLLELESNLDKCNQIQLRNEDKYDELLVFLKNDTNNKVSLISEENALTS